MGPLTGNNRFPSVSLILPIERSTSDDRIQEVIEKNEQVGYATATTKGCHPDNNWSYLRYCIPINDNQYVLNETNIQAT